MRGRSQRAMLAAVVLSVIGICRPGVAQKPPAAGTADAAAANDFEARVKQYLDFRQQHVGPPAKPTDNPAKIVSRQREMGNQIRVARAGAKQGEIFAPAIAQYFRKQIAASFAGRYGNGIRASLAHAEPVKVELQINQSYPPDQPLQSTPPTLLLNLPELADGLEYRVLNRELVLRDTQGNVVIDYVPNALPESVK
jgi:hypothetical protein